MRLTEKGLDIHKTSRYATSPEVYDLYDKLSKLEDVEDRVGVDLVKLLTAKTIYFMDWDITHAGQLAIEEIDSFSINVNAKKLDIHKDLYSNASLSSLHFADYGKKNKYGGWALTKEELEEKK